MKRILPIIVTQDNKKVKRRIAVHPSQISFIEEVSSTSCNIVVDINDRSYIYLCPKPFKYLYNFTNLTTFNLFIEN